MIIFVLPKSEFILQANADVAALWPLPKQYTTISSNYYAQRGNGIHKAIDIPAPEGTDIYAVLDGEVIFSGVLADSKDSCGNTVILYHSSIGKYTVYCHASSLCVSKGQKVSQGTVIAKVGNTGDSFGNHLDFKLCTGYQTTGVPWPRGHQDPMSYFSWQYDIIPSNPYISISGYDPLPSGKLPQGKSYPIKGIVSGYPNINHVWGGVYNRDGSKTSQYLDKYVDTGSYNLATYFDPYIIFNDLPIGYYTFKIEATTTDGQYKEIHSDFQIGDPPSIGSGTGELPTAPSLSIYKSAGLATDTISIAWDSIQGADSYWIHIYKDGKDYVNQTLNQALSYSAKYPVGNYVAYVVSCNSIGEASSMVEFKIYNGVPGKPNPKTYKTLFAANETVDIIWSATANTDSYWLHIYKNGEDYVNQTLEQGLSYSATYSAGKYVAYIVSCNGIAETLSSVEFTVYDSAPEKPNPKINKTVFSTSEKVNITWEAIENVECYWLHIYKDDEEYVNKSLDQVLSYSSSYPAGKYVAYIVSCNSYGETLGSVAFQVIGNLNVILNANGGICSTESVTVTYGETYNSLPEPSRSGYIFGGWFTAESGGAKVTASTIVTANQDHELYAHWEKNKVVGDVNADGTFNVADVVMLQKWLTCTSDVALIEWQAADLYEDGIIDVVDLCMMKKRLING